SRASCRSTSSPRLPTSAPGPPPRVRRASGLQCGISARTSTSASTSNRISGRLHRGDDHGPEDETAGEYERCRERGAPLAGPADRVERERYEDPGHADPEREEHAPAVLPEPQRRPERE